MFNFISRKVFISLLSCSMLICLSIVSVNVKACDTTPFITATNATDIGGGFFTFDMLVCLGNRGSVDGFDVTMNCGLNITATSMPGLNNGGRIATSSIVGGVLIYDYPGSPPTDWEPDDLISGPCFSFTVTVDGNPAGCTATLTGVNDGCVGTTAWSATLVAACIVDFTITAPASQAGNTAGGVNNCANITTEDQTIEVIILCTQDYTFSLCAGTTFDTQLFLSTTCCGPIIASNDDFCGEQSEITVTNLAAGTYYVTIEGIANTGPFSVGSYTLNVTSASPCTLPVELLSFEGKKQDDNTNLLSWETLSEINNDYFTLERGTQNEKQIIWEEIGELDGAGNSNVLLNYRFVDKSPNYNTVSYYRLNQTDFDGSSKYSKIITLQPSEIDGFEISNLYPNPTENQFSFTLLGKANNLETLAVSIYNSVGENVKRAVFFDVSDQANFKVSVADLNNGVYFVNIKIGDKKLVEKLTILR